MADWDDEPTTSVGGDYQTKNDGYNRSTATQLLSNGTKQDEKIESKPEEVETPDDNNVSTRL